MMDRVSLKDFIQSLSNDELMTLSDELEKVVGNRLRSKIRDFIFQNLDGLREDINTISTVDRLKFFNEIVQYIER